MTRALFLAALVAAVLSASGQTSRPDDVERMVRDGLVEALEARFRGSATLDELRLLARAASNKASKTREPAARQRAFEDAERRYQKSIDALDKSADDAVVRAVQGGELRAEFGAMVLSRWVGPELDELDLSLGARGDAARAVAALEKARQAYDAALKRIEPHVAALERGGAEVEDRLLALGVLDAIRKLRLDGRFNLGWTCLYIAQWDAKSADNRKACLRVAESSFRALVASAQTQPTQARIELGLAMALREQNRWPEAEALFDSAQRGVAGGALEVQIRCERARNDIAAGRFAESREVLKPLLIADAEKLGGEQRAALFYYNLALVIDAHSHLAESAALLAQAEKSSAREAIVLRAQRAREAGLTRLDALMQRGGAWPALVQAILKQHIRPDADLAGMTPLELLLVARELADQKRYGVAALRLEELLRRRGVPENVVGEARFELGMARFRQGEHRPAAEQFDALLRDLPSHARAEQAALHAYQLWAMVADASKDRADYRRLADALALVLQRYPRFERRDEVAWWLPVALQSAGGFAEAAQQFAAVNEASPKWEEAQYRKAVCARLEFDSLPPDAAIDVSTKLASRAADALLAYSRAAETRADASRDPQATRTWSLAARVSAAEVYVREPLARHQTALELLSDLEHREGAADLVGRILAVRIQAYRGLRRLEDAARVVSQFVQSTPADQAGSVLAGVARGVLDELERMQREGADADARNLAAASIATFEQLDAFASGEASRDALRRAARIGLARVLILSGRPTEALPVVEELLKQDAANGEVRRLHALARSAVAEAPDAAPETLAAAREAWSMLLADGSLRAARPELYWEARYHFLALLVREGRLDEVRRAIAQQRVWDAELGGPRWRERFAALEQTAAGEPASQPAVEP